MGQLVGFTGSRHWETWQLARVKDVCEDLVVRWLTHDPNVTFHVGDAEGVDTWILHSAIKYHAPIVVFGVNGRARSLEKDLLLMDIAGVQLRSIQVKPGRGMYIVRDQALAKSVDSMYAIWNRSSKGTMHTLNFAWKLNKKCFLWMDDGEDVGRYYGEYS